MATYAAFLRGMNLGGRRISNDDLRKSFADIGFDEVGVFRASGNVAVEAGNATHAELTDKIEKGLEETLGYAVPTFLRTADELRAGRRAAVRRCCDRGGERQAPGGPVAGASGQAGPGHRAGPVDRS